MKQWKTSLTNERYIFAKTLHTLRTSKVPTSVSSSQGLSSVSDQRFLQLFDKS